MKVQLKYIVEDMDRHGNVRLYFRKRGEKKVRLRVPYNTSEFWEIYEALKAGNPVPDASDEMIAPDTVKDGSFEWLCREYYSSAPFRLLSKRTQTVRRGILNKICAIAGKFPANELSVKHICKMRDDRVDRPESANGMIKALRQLYKYGLEYEHVTSNPARDIPYLKSGSQGFHAWTLAEVRQFEKCHPVGTKARLAFDLLLYTAQRRADIVRLGRQHMDDGWLSFTQQKNENRNPVTVEIPVVEALAKSIAAAPTGDLTFLVTEFGKPFSNAGFGNKFRGWCNEAGLEHCSAHGLRKATAARLAELGCTEHEIMAVTGHTTMKEVERYTRSARRKILAGRAMQKLSGASKKG